MRFTANLNFFHCISRALSEPKILVPEICLPTGNPVLGITIILHTVFYSICFPRKKTMLKLICRFSPRDKPMFSYIVVFPNFK